MDRGRGQGRGVGRGRRKGEGREGREEGKGREGIHLLLLQAHTVVAAYAQSFKF